MSTPVTPQEFRAAAANAEARNDIWAQSLLIAAAEQVATLTADVFATKTAMDLLQNELSEARTALAKAVEQIRVLQGLLDYSL